MPGRSKTFKKTVHTSLPVEKKKRRATYAKPYEPQFDKEQYENAFKGVDVTDGR